MPRFDRSRVARREYHTYGPTHADATAMRPKRTLRRPTRWTPDEWRRVADAAKRRGVPPSRFVREAALTISDEAEGRPVLRGRVRVGDELVRQLGRLLNNLNQLRGVAEDEGADEMARIAGDVARMAEQAIRFAPRGAREAEPVLREVLEAGRALNELTHQAHAADALPSLAEAARVLDAVAAAVLLAHA